MNISFRSIFCVWERYFDVFRKNLVYGLITTFATPFVYLGSFAFGMSRMLGTVQVHGVNLAYRDFIFAGIVAQTLLFQAFFEAAYGGFVRMYYQKIFKSIAMTSITLKEVLLAELAWNCSRSLFSSVALLLFGFFAFHIPFFSLLLTLPVLIVSAFLFSGMGLISAALSKTIEDLSYPQILIVIPMSLFCGVYYPLESLPHWAQIPLSLLPLTSMVELLRSALFGIKVSYLAVINLCIWTTIFVPWSLRSLEKRVRA